jgi:hypothetical protein
MAHPGVTALSRWDIEIIDADNGQLRNAMERRYYSLSAGK